MRTTVLPVLALVVACFALAWSAYLQFGRRVLVVDRVVAKSVSADSFKVVHGGQTIAVLGRSSLTGAGGLVLLDARGKDNIVISSGAFAINGGDPRQAKRLLHALRGYAVIISGDEESSTLCMKGVSTYDVVIEAGKTEDDPLDIRGGRMNLRSVERSVKVDAHGAQLAPARNW